MVIALDLKSTMCTSVFTEVGIILTYVYNPCAHTYLLALLPRL